MYKALPTFDATAASWPAFIFKFRLMLEGKELLYVIDRDAEDPGVGGSAENRKIFGIGNSEWAKDDAKVRGMFVNKLSDVALSLVQDCKTASEMISRMEAQYESNSAASALTRLDRLFDIQHKDGEDISATLGAVNAIVNQIELAGGLDIQKLHVVVLLRAMPKTTRWQSLITSLKTQDEGALTKEKVSRAFTEFANELESGKPIEVRPRRENPTAFNVERDMSKVRCYKCGKIGHFQANCRVAGKTPVAAVAVKSVNLKAAVKGNARKGSSFAFASMSNLDNDQRWVKDSGASGHFTCNRDVFATFKEVSDELHIANGETVRITGIGSVIFDAECADGIVNEVTLREVYYAPDLKVNLVSTPALDQLGLSENSSNGLTTFSLNGGEVMCAEKIGNRWIMKITPRRLAALSATTVEHWHKRMCHLSAGNLEKLRSMVNGFDSTGTLTTVCDGCNKGKMTRRPFKSSTNPRAKFPLDLVHMDMVVINVKGNDNETVALICTDDHSGCRFSFPLSSRSGESIWEAISEWLPWAERVTNRKLRAIRHDNAKEFIGGIFRGRMKTLGVEQQTTVPYEHEQNGTAENSNRVLMDKARCILLDCKLDRSYWPDALLTATFAANRSPFAGHDVTPIEKFTGVRPNLSNMRVFGSKCWARIPTEKLRGSRKLDSRSIVCIFLGYVRGGSAYRVQDASTGRFFETTNAKFDENAFQPVLGILDKGRVDLDESESDDDADVPENAMEAPDDDGSVYNDAIEETVVPGQLSDDAQDGDASLRRGTRNRQPVKPYWLFDHRSHVHYAYLTYSEARHDAGWCNAMDLEFRTLQEYNTWVLGELPNGRKAVGSKWVLNVKPDGTKKARLVARGFTQIEGIDFFDTFAPIAKPATIRMFFIVANNLKYFIHQADVRAAYLNGDIDEEVWMDQPPGYEASGKDGQKLHCKLVKALYGTKQAGRVWRKCIREFLEQLGFKMSLFDPCLFTRGSYMKGNWILIIIWVDDILTAYATGTQRQFSEFWKKLSARFNVKDMGAVEHYIGIDISRDVDKQVMVLSQKTALEEVLMHFGMMDVKTRVTPMIDRLQLYRTNEIEETTDKPYRSLVGCLMYPMLWTRPDLAHAVGTLGQFASNPSNEHWKAGMDVLRYIRGEMDLSLVFKGSDDYSLVGYADSDFATDRETGKSVYGYAFFIGSSLVSWRSKKSKSVATSSTIAEVEALYQACIEGIWLFDMLESLGLPVKKPFKIWEDNQAVIAIVNGERYLERTKHEVVKIEFIRDKIQNGIVVAKYLETGEMTADVFTKSLGKNLFKKHVEKLGLSKEVQIRGSVEM